MTKTLIGLAIDSAGIAGLALIALGAGQIYAPAGVIMGGIELVGLAFLASQGRK